MWGKLFLFAACLQIALGAPQQLMQCPEICSCSKIQDSVHLQCSSFSFLKKLSPKEYPNIATLSITNSSIVKIDPKLKYLNNLRTVDLSNNEVDLSTLPPLKSLTSLTLRHNNLKYINLSTLPTTLKALDLSNNYIAQIPTDWRHLKSLESIDLHKNPIDCECNNVLIYQDIINHGIRFPNTMCANPTKLVGKFVHQINCSIWADLMLYDEAAEGSGASEIVEGNEEYTPLYEDRSNSSDNALDSDDNAYMDNTYTVIHDTPDNVNNDSSSSEDIFADNDSIENNSIIEDDLLSVNETNTGAEAVAEEGSGDEEGSGMGVIISELPVPVACHVNCSTPRPVGENDEEYASPVPSFVDQAKILYDDVRGVPDEDQTPTTTTTMKPQPEQVEEEVLQKEVEPELTRQSDKDENVELLAVNDQFAGEMERASIMSKNSNTVYTVIGVFIIIVIVLLIYVLRKRRSRRRRQEPNDYGQELKSMQTPVIGSINEKPVNKSLSIPENIPLLNGKDKVPKLHTFIPLKQTDDADDAKLNHPDDDDAAADDEVDYVLRQKSPNSDVLTPPQQRVTIKESELLDSIPKTPMLVHRQKNSDGEIITTVVPS